jgi:hypothetical protein
MAMRCRLGRRVVKTTLWALGVSNNPELLPVRAVRVRTANERARVMASCMLMLALEVPVRIGDL